MNENEYESADEVDEVESSEEEVAVKKKRRVKKWKDPNKPKRAMSAFFLYSQENRPRVKEESPDASFGDVARLLSGEYKALTDKQMKKYTKLAEADKARYQEQMESYVPTEEAGGKKKKAKKDPNAPKRNMSSYFLYSVHARPSVKEENPEATFGDIARLISKQFKALTDKEKKKWEKKALEDKERYKREMEVYTA